MSASFSLIFCPLAAKADVTAPQGDMCKQDKPKAVIAIKEYDNNFLNEFLNKYLNKVLLCIPIFLSISFIFLW